MLGLKSFRTARVVIGGIELAERLKKGQFKIGKLGGSKATMPEIWQGIKVVRAIGAVRQQRFPDELSNPFPT
jgi:hypothetical protein